MERFIDQPLSRRPHLAVFGSDKVGNFVLTTPASTPLIEKIRLEPRREAGERLMH